ncbi:hypothetical protein IQ241_22835 [Romeria aff. gracilis LEGE 07310]|uniref:Uncharacterized protein n=1 Tax=Vasconcelosia minhoensis LEGE 07310 TaxID=915328 RepID=A0A8J7DDP5_9CYAN|nr:hypothetical protein [Romeria gracilis]MBE9080092.1 hypothetical protein [Romeria aff. gracilis LEGE 07310]
MQRYSTRLRQASAKVAVCSASASPSQRDRVYAMAGSLLIGLSLLSLWLSV